MLGALVCRQAALEGCAQQRVCSLWGLQNTTEYNSTPLFLWQNPQSSCLLRPGRGGGSDDSNKSGCVKEKVGHEMGVRYSS
jgi:hypothetical protein